MFETIAAIWLIRVRFNQAKSSHPFCSRVGARIRQEKSEKIIIIIRHGWLPSREQKISVNHLQRYLCCFCVASVCLKNQGDHVCWAPCIHQNQWPLRFANGNCYFWHKVMLKLQNFHGAKTIISCTESEKIQEWVDELILCHSLLQPWMGPQTPPASSWAHRSRTLSLLSSRFLPGSFAVGSPNDVRVVALTGLKLKGHMLGDEASKHA